MLLDKVEHLGLQSHKFVRIQCDYCGEVVKKMYRTYINHGDTDFVEMDCCNKCRRIKNTHASLIKYGVSADSNLIKLLIEIRSCDFSAIYYIKNINNNKLYIGSTRNVLSRLKNHLYELQSATHSAANLQIDYLKHGWNVFEFDIIEIVKDKKLLNEKENHYINTYNTLDSSFGYNTLRPSLSAKKKSKPSKTPNLSSAKLSAVNVLEIKEKISQGIPLYIIAEEYGVHDGTISSIKTGATWSHLKSNYDPLLKDIKPDYRGENNACSKLTEYDVKIIKKRIDDKEQLTSIARDYNVSRTLIGHIKRGKLWSHVS